MSSPEIAAGVHALAQDTPRGTSVEPQQDLAAAWRSHVDRLREQLLDGWAAQVERIFEERFTELAGRLGEEFEREIEARRKAEVDAILASARGAAARELSQKLNATARRLLQADSRQQWVAALLDSTNGFCSRAALFSVLGQNLHFERAVGFPENGSTGDLLAAPLPLPSAPAFASAVESLDMVVSMHSPGELSAAVAQGLPASDGDKVHLFPISSHNRAVAVLLAKPGAAQPVDVNALELLSALAALGWEMRTARQSAVSSLVSIAAPKPASPPAPSWLDLSLHEQDLHLRAQRFALVQVAEMILYRSSAVKAGRAGQDLYILLREEIDRGRVEFRRQFLDGCASMVDYLHRELVRTLANDDVSSLGNDYPGPLV